MGCWFCVVAMVCSDGFNNQTTSDQHLSKIGSESIKVWSRIVLGPFRVAGRAKDGFRTPAQESVFDIFNILSGRGCRKGAFLDIPKIENGTNIAQRREDQHEDPLKMFPGSSVENT